MRCYLSCDSSGLYGSIYFHLECTVVQCEQEEFVHPSADGFGSCVCLLAPCSSAASSGAVWTHLCSLPTHTLVYQSEVSASCSDCILKAAKAFLLRFLCLRCFRVSAACTVLCQQLFLALSLQWPASQLSCAAVSQCSGYSFLCQGS